MDQLLEAAFRQVAAGGQLDLNALMAGVSGGPAVAPALPAPALQGAPLAAAAAVAVARGSNETTVVRSGSVSAALRPVTNLPQVLPMMAAGKAAHAAAAAAGAGAAR